MTAGEPGSAPDDTWPSPPQIPQSNPVAELTRRVQNLEKSPLLEVVEKPATIPVPKGAPVKRDNAKLIFSVRPDSTRVYGPGNIPVAGIRATEDGGQFVARSADGALAAFVGASGSRNVGVLIEEGGVPRLDVGKQPAGNYALIVPSNIDGPIAGIGETRGKLGGTLVIGDEAGRMKAQMAVVDNKGTFAIHNASGAILLLKEATNGAGMLAINTASKAAVKMDVNDDRYGVVLAGPTLGFPLVPSSGLPGSYILGCAGGAGCRPY